MVAVDCFIFLIITAPLAAESTPELRFHPDFDDMTDDVVLESSDGVHFRIHSVILRKASTVFSDMLAIPGPPGLPNSSTPASVPLPESSDILERGLRLISSSPIPSDTFSTIASIEESAKFCDKYGMHGGLSILRIVAASVQYRLDEPLTLYKLACAYEWDDIVEKTALYCIQDDPSSPIIYEVLRGLRINDYLRLISLAYRRRVAFDGALYRPYNLFPYDNYNGCVTCRQWPTEPTAEVWSAFRNRAIIEFQQHPGGDGFYQVDKWPETVALKRVFLVCKAHADVNWATAKQMLEAIGETLPKV